MLFFKKSPTVPMSIDSLTKEQVLEELCAQGCQRVNLLLADNALQQQQTYLQQLCDTDREWVLHELKSVMSVYALAGSCSID